MTGVERRLSRVFSTQDRRAVVVPMDDSLISGPQGGLLRLDDMVRDAAESGPAAFLGFSGQFRRHAAALTATGWIFNLTASTTLASHTRKRLIQSALTASTLGCDAVAAHINVGSKYEPEMLTSIGTIVDASTSIGLPVLIIAYPRTEGGGGEDDNFFALRETDEEAYTRLVCHAVRLAVDLGASAVKTQFTGSAESFSEVVRAADSVPVLIAGGPQVGSLEALSVAAMSVAAGGSGVSFGRNVFHHVTPGKMVSALKSVVHGGLSADDAFQVHLSRASE